MKNHDTHTEAQNELLHLHTTNINVRVSPLLKIQLIERGAKMGVNLSDYINHVITLQMQAEENNIDIVVVDKTANDGLVVADIHTLLGEKDVTIRDLKMELEFSKTNFNTLSTGFNVLNEVYAKLDNSNDELSSKYNQLESQYREVVNHRDKILLELKKVTDMQEPKPIIAISSRNILLLFIGIPILFYLTGSFFSISFNIAQWHDMTRFFVSFAAMTVMLVLFSLVFKIKKH